MTVKNIKGYSNYNQEESTEESAKDVMKDGKYALILVVESNKKNKGDILNKYDTGRVEIPYEDEAVMCVSSWRKNGGKYKDIPIYAINVNNNPPSLAAQAILDRMGVKYIEEYFPITQLFPCGYYNVPIACAYLENILKEEILIHIDLDMYLVREPDDRLFALEDKHKCKIAVNEWPPTSNLKEDVGEKYPFEIATNFIVARRKDAFYTTWYSKLKGFLEDYDGLFTDKTLSIFEERICDIMYWKENYPFCFVRKGYQINHDEIKVKDPFFLHCHLDNERRFHKLMKVYMESRK